MGELRIITEERNARNAELQRRIELRKLAKLKKKKQEEVDEAVIQSAELVVRELTEIVTNKVFSSFSLSQDFEIVTNKGSNIPRLCRVGECEECEKEKKCECECENCKEVRIGNETVLYFAYLHICTMHICIFVYLYIFYIYVFAYLHICVFAHCTQFMQAVHLKQQ